MDAVRTCVGCRQRSERSKLLRIVVRNGELLLDETASLPGRGAWMHPAKSCLKLALDRGAFARALRAKITLTLTLEEQAEMMLAKK